jgi:hypothetical protein
MYNFSVDEIANPFEFSEAEVVRATEYLRPTAVRKHDGSTSPL